MSNDLAIAAVSLTLRARLFNALSGEDVTMTSPDAATSGGTDHLNLFLYRTSTNAAFRNADMNRLSDSNAPGLPPLPLILHYLVSVYAADDQRGQMLLGSAMAALHDPALLTPDEIAAATVASLPQSDLHRQVERVKITHETITTEEMSRLWTAFQAPYRLSAAYELSVVLIEAPRRLPVGLPVLRRGADDRQPAASASATSPYPTLASVSFPVPGQPSAHAGDAVTLVGSNLDAGPLRVHLRSVRTGSDTTVDLPVAASADAVALALPAGLTAGVYVVDATVLDAGPPVTETVRTNQIALAIAPSITYLAVGHGLGSAVTITVTTASVIDVAEEVVLFVDSRAVASPVRQDPTAQIEFLVTGLTAATEYRIRLRVNGVDSHLVDWAARVYRPDQKVVTPA